MAEATLMSEQRTVAMPVELLDGLKEVRDRLTRDLAMTGKAAGRYPTIAGIEALQNFRDAMAERLRQLEAGIER